MNLINLEARAVNVDDDTVKFRFSVTAFLEDDGEAQVAWLLVGNVRGIGFKKGRYYIPVIKQIPLELEPARKPEGLKKGDKWVPEEWTMEVKRSEIAVPLRDVYIFSMRLAPAHEINPSEEKKFFLTKDL